MIFLSASIPDPRRNPKYFETADIVAIRDCIRALATVVIPNTNLIWGGHPAITPLIKFILEKMGKKSEEHLILYLSLFKEKEFSDDVNYFKNVIKVPSNKDLESSLFDLRIKMITENEFSAGIFVGGMEGVEKEFELFVKYHPKTATYPIASTGGAALSIFQNGEFKWDIRLLQEYAYMSLFKSLLKI